MKKRNKSGHLPLKKVYYGQFMGLIVIPLFAVLIAALLVLNQQFKKQALENIDRAQETVIAELLSDVDVMSMRLSHIIYTNDSEILTYASGASVGEATARYENNQKLAKAVGMMLEPVTDVISLQFIMKNGEKSYVKNDITKPISETRESTWYQQALEQKNKIYVGSYDTEKVNDLYMGSRKDTLVLVFAFSPDVITDLSNQIEMVLYYQSTGASERIKDYNRNYLSGANKLGIMEIVDENGSVIYATKEGDYRGAEYTCVSSGIQLHDTVWQIKSYIPTRELTADFWNTAFAVLGVAALILLLASYFSRYFLRSIIRPVGEISDGLKQIEEGNLDVHITPSGQYEIRTMIHQFNAMERRLKALIEEYEEKVRCARTTPEDYFKAIVAGKLLPGEAKEQSGKTFEETYVLMRFSVPGLAGGEETAERIRQLVLCFDRNPRFASRCMAAVGPKKEFVVYYRVMEEEYEEKLLSMVRELQRAAQTELEQSLAVCIGERCSGVEAMYEQLSLLDTMLCFYRMYGKSAIVRLQQEKDMLWSIYRESEQYRELAKALYIADEKNVVADREILLNKLSGEGVPEAKRRMYAVVLAISRYFDEQNVDFSEVFGQDYNYKEKIDRLDDLRSLKLWLTNYFAWIIDYSASKLNLSETDIIIKAKRYIVDHYEDAELTLNTVAEYVGLNEKYFSNRFTRETGETFSAYLTELRLQKSKELLKSTTFKIYEIAEMVGYHNAEHFNRMFKKYNGISPAQYRKTM